MGRGGRLGLRYGPSRGRLIRDRKRRNHLRGQVTKVGGDDTDGGVGRLLGDAFDHAFSAAGVAEGQTVRQTTRGQAQALAAVTQPGITVGSTETFRSGLKNRLSVAADLIPAS